jgi:xanthine/uracil permease
MLKLFGAIYVLSAPTIMGILIVALLTMNRFDSTQILIAAVVGAVLAVPVAALVTKQIAAPRRRA